MVAQEDVVSQDPERAWLEALHREHFVPLVRVAVLLTGDAGLAEDLTQDAFADLWRRRRKLTDPGRAAGYLRRSVVNRCRSAQRHLSVVRRKQPALLARDPDQPDPATRAVVLDALRQLPTRQREVLVLRHYLDLSEAQIADHLGISPGSVKTHASRGAAALRELLKETP